MYEKPYDTGIIGVSGGPTKDTPLFAEINELEQQVKMLSDSLSILASRLDVMLRPNSPTTSNQQTQDARVRPPAPSLSLVAERLKSLRYFIADLNTGVADTLCRLDI